MRPNPYFDVPCRRGRWLTELTAVAADAPVGAGEPRGVAELRALRAGRHRWD